MNPIKDPIKDTLVPLRTNFNADGSVRWCTSVYLNLFHWPIGKISGNRNGVCRYIRAVTSYHLLSYLVNWFKLVYGPFGHIKMHSTLNFCPDQTGRIRMYQS